MTERQRFKAQQQRVRIWNREQGRCFVCGGEGYELAHRIPKTKAYLKRYGKEIIEHDLNKLLTCSACNQSVLIDPKTHPIEAAELVEQIKARLEEENID